MMHSIRAVAVNTIRQAVRMKIVAVFVLLLLVLLPVMGSAMGGDGTLKGRLQTFVSYGLSLTGFLLCLLTIAVSIYSLTSDLGDRQIYMVLTKPVKRYQLMIGKLAGVIILDAILLFFFSAFIYSITLAIPKFTKTSPEQIDRVNDEFFTARASLRPAEVDVSAEVQQQFQKGIKDGSIPQRAKTDRDLYGRVIATLTKEAKKDSRSVIPARELLWEFNNVKPANPGDDLYLRFQYDVSKSPHDLKVTGKWIAGDVRKFGDKIDVPIFTYESRDLIRTYQEIKIPSDVIADDGYLGVVFYNDPQLNDTVVMFTEEEGLEILYKADSFSWNFARAALLIFCRLIFLAALGVFSATFLSFPVAILLCIVVFFTGVISGFIFDSFDSLSENMGTLYFYTVRPLIKLLPQLDKANPTGYLVEARLLSWAALGRIAFFMVALKSMILFLVSIIIFSYKEIAKVII